jgi:hypothetical protein
MNQKLIRTQASASASKKDDANNASDKPSIFAEPLQPSHATLADATTSPL